ncbi:uncharacterized protein LOC131252558 [Magnolia sinica]|uniref:uncharacterized protein LOC131252558 n=1 Tax=Magnolia sinica TaxID=86752 RepID=UPI0026595B9A|nr:uncharacterized protein LOC131252558 [Magnolia sinica]
MNRSFRAAESKMQAPVQQQRQGRSLGAVMKDKEEDLALFLEMRKREKERNSLLLLHTSEDFDPPLGSKPGGSPIFKIVSSTPRKTASDDFLNSDGEKNDYDWLLTPPGTPLFPSLEVESNKSTLGQIVTPKARPTALKSRLANPQMEPSSRGNLVSRQPTSSSSLTSSNLGTRRPSSSGGPGSVASRPATPTGRPTLLATNRPSRPSTPTSRATVPSRATIPSSKPIAPSARSSTPTARPSLTASKSSSSTPTAWPSLTASKSSSRSATPTRRPSTPSSAPSSSIPPVRSSSVTKSAPSASKNPVPSRGTSPTVKSRPWKPSEMPGFSLDAPPNLRTSMPERPVSASRGRPGAPSSRSSSVEAVSNGRPRRQSCSPLRGRTPNGSIHSSGSSVPVTNRSYSNGTSDSVSPVVIGNKMVERVINMRRLAPPKQDDHPRSFHNNSAGKSLSSPDSSGFGRNLSKKSLDMALRHMDIRRSNPGSLRPLMTNIPASSMYSVRSGPTKSRTASILDSPLATSSNASSEQSVSNNIHCLEGSEIDDDVGSERGGRSSPASQRGR